MAVRLTAKLRVQAAIRRCSALGLSAMVVGRGDPDAGQILVKINRFEAGCEVLVEARDGAGETLWTRGSGADLVSEAEADAYLDRQRRVDPDLWVLEVEDRAGRNPFADYFTRGDPMMP